MTRRLMPGSPACLPWADFEFRPARLNWTAAACPAQRSSPLAACPPGACRCDVRGCGGAFVGAVCTTLQGPGRLSAVFKFARQQGTPLAWCVPYGLDAPKKVRRCPVPVPRGLNPAQNRGGQHFAQG